MNHKPYNLAMTLICLLGLASTGSTAATEPSATSHRIGDPRLSAIATIDAGRLLESQFLVDGKPLPDLNSLAWTARINGKEYTPLNARPKSDTSTTHTNRAVFEGTTDTFHWSVHYTRTNPGRVSKTLTITALADLLIERVTLWQATSAAAPIVPKTSSQEIAALYRFGDRGLFASLDFPYSRIESNKNTTTISYPPFRSLAKGQTYEAHSLTIGATSLTHRIQGNHDIGEIDALDAYVQERFKPRFERPMNISCCIVNRYTQVQGNVIFYTMKDHPTLCGHTDILERELALMPRLGMEWYQVFPGVFDWGPDDPKPSEVTRLMDVARSNNVRMGDYSGTSSVFCPHYNEYLNSLNRPEWVISNEDGKPRGGYCFGNPAFVDYYINTVVPNGKKYGFEIHCLDFLNISPCHATNHNHPPGRDSLYHQVAGLIRLLDAISSISPQMLTWSNSGNWAEFLPKIAWANPNLYLTDPFIHTPWQGLNMTRLLDDARREQMVSLHNSRFIPYRNLTNCQYFFSQNSIVPDIRHYEYGALSTLAVTPNLCLGEIRPWLDRLSETDQRRVIAFYKHWTDFIRDHFDLWKRTYQAGDEPGPGSIEVYSHAAGDHGYIFIVNPQYWSRTANVTLDCTLGFDAKGPCEIAELYPTPRLRLIEQQPFAQFGSTVAIDAPAQQVIVLEVRPAPKSIDSPRLYGLPGTITKDGDGYRIKTQGPQGSTQSGVVMLAKGSPAITGADVHTDIPVIPKRLQEPTGLAFRPLPEGGAQLDVTFRRTRTPSELRDWTVRPGTLKEGQAAGWHKGLKDGDGERVHLPLFNDVYDPRIKPPITETQLTKAGLGPLAGFCGGFIENALSETQETWLQLQTGGKPKPTQTGPANAGTASQPEHPTKTSALPALATDTRTNWWLQSRFNLPFMYMIGAEPAFDEHTILVLPMLTPSRVKSISAWINGTPLDVRQYRYPRNRGLGCYYADLVGSAARGGPNVLVLQLTY